MRPHDDAAQLVAVLERYRPEQILLGRMAFGPTVMKLVHERYRRWNGDPARSMRLYVRDDLETGPGGGEAVRGLASNHLDMMR